MAKVLKKVTLESIPIGEPIEVRASKNIDLDFYQDGDFISVDNSIYKIVEKK